MKMTTEQLQQIEVLALISTCSFTVGLLDKTQGEELEKTLPNLLCWFEFDFTNPTHRQQLTEYHQKFLQLLKLLPSVLSHFQLLLVQKERLTKQDLLQKTEDKFNRLLLLKEVEYLELYCLNVTF